MPVPITRRRFITATSAAAAGVTLLPGVTRNVLGANEKLNIAAVGAGGKGAVDVNLTSSQNIIALCDVDANNAAATFKRFDKATTYTDFRVMLDRHHKEIDAVTVSTPDHLHAVAAIAAMKLGKHVYCQKPLTHSVAEARLMTKVAREMKIVTQMGNQGHNHNASRRLVELIQAGAIGDVTEAHVWTDRPIWPQGQRAISEVKKHAGKPVPGHLDWNLWLGPAKDRPYNAAYLPFKWRGFWDFGTGALGDMGCHNMDLCFWALKLRDPVAVEAQTSEDINDVAAPTWSIITHHYGPRDGMPACKFVWYDGGKKPDAALVKKNQLPRNGSIIVGTKDTLYVPHYWGSGTFVSGRTMSDFDSIPQTLPRTAGSDEEGNIDLNHHLEWIAAIKTGDPSKSLSNFDYAGPMTEAVLLGNVAMRAGQRIEWDAKNLRVINAPEANRWVHDEYRKGWELERVV